MAVTARDWFDVGPRPGSLNLLGEDVRVFALFHERLLQPNMETLSSDGPRPADSTRFSHLLRRFNANESAARTSFRRHGMTLDFPNSSHRLC